MHEMERLKDMLCDKLDEYAAEGKLTTTTLDVIHKLTDTIKNIGKIEMLEEASEYSEYSNRRDGRRSSYTGGSYDGGSSYENYSGRRRDSRGRYARDGRSSRRGYSREEAKEEMIEQIEQMMMNASSEKEREALMRCMTALQND